METMEEGNKATELLERLQGEVEQLRTSEQWQRFLQMQARLHKYSFNNVLLIASQRPDATYVAGFNRWKELERHVTKGEKGIAILVPYSGVRHLDAPKLLTRADGSVESVTEERFTYFRVGYVFDISQTEGKDCVVEWGYATGDHVTAQDALGRLTTMAASLGFTVEREASLGTARGYCDHKKHRIVLRTDLDAVRAVATLAHEVAHAVLHDGLTPAEYHEARGRYEVEAEAIAYVVGTGLGLEMASDALPYIAGWSKDNPKLVREVCQRVAATANRILATATDAPAEEAAA